MSDSPTASLPRTGLVAGVVGLLVLVATVLATGAVAGNDLGLPDTDALTRWLLPLASFGTDIAVVVAVAGLLLAPLTMHKMRDELHPRATQGVRVARTALGVGVVLSLVEAWATVADQQATDFFSTSLGTVVDAFGTTTQVQSLTAQALALLALTLGLGTVDTPRRAVFAIGFTLAALVPTTLTGHSASSGSHDAAVVSLLLHVVAAVVWTSGIAALWALLVLPETERGRATRRFSALAGWCFGVTAVTGAINAWVRLGEFSDLFTSGYGRAALLKLVILVGLGVLAARLRRSVVTTEVAPEKRGFALLTAIELTALSAAVALGAALSRTAPPVGAPWPGKVESLLGGPLPPEPTAGRILTSFQFSGFGTAVVVLGVVGYLVGLRTLRRRGDTWPVGRTIAWFLGLLAVAFATIGGLGVYSGVMFSWHMTSHMVISMLAPVLLVMGSPITLALRALPGPETPGGDGPRQLLVSFLNSTYSKVVTNPAFATIMFTGSLYAIYFTGAFDWLMDNHLGHALMELHFLLAGYLYYEVLIGTAPLPKRLPHLGRLGILLLVAPFHAFFAIAVMSSSTVIGESFYALLERPYSSNLLDDQYLAGSLTWAMGEVPLLLVGVVLIFQWFRDDSRRAKQRDRKADRDDDAELARYNAMLGRIAEGTATRGDRDPSTRIDAPADESTDA
ncbi:cytochrome c oxidase assembly protein [Nocardioides yefusunii]|uniref:Cytochrome c oxidase assembly protein n=1 Tax=Nocardioides yefusunii TaxID=2500546 RepID=A0ABW1QWT6_9ACTN|nr:cytochrome c oxidase assembly protein [Nocardioides yefusunii]